MAVSSVNIAFIVSVALLASITGALRPLLNVTDCGKSKLTLASRVLGGRKAHPGELPWVVRVEAKVNSKQSILCTGSLITPIHVITALHCSHANVSAYEVSYGAVDHKRGRKLKVKAQYRPNEVNETVIVKGVPLNDVLILVLEDEVEFGPTTGAICLPDDVPVGSLVGHEVQVAGFGLSEKYGTASPTLLTVPQTVIAINSSRCQQIQTYGQEHEICVYSEHKSVCQGDSGGPLMLVEDGVYYQVGVASYSVLEDLFVGCPAEGVPQIFARIAPLKDFILHTVDTTGGARYVPKQPN